MALCNSNIVGCVKKIAVHRARLVLGWVTIFGGQQPDIFTKPTQPPTLIAAGNEYWAKGSDALQLGYDRSFHMWINV